jgi:ribosome-binding factor A
MARDFSRNRRVEEAIQRIISGALSSQVRDPRLAGLIVTGVQVSRDLSLAKIFLAHISRDSVGDEAGRALDSAKGFMRSLVASELRIRHVPELRFLPDKSLEQARNLDRLIQESVDRGGSSSHREGGQQDEPG